MYLGVRCTTSAPTGTGHRYCADKFTGHVNILGLTDTVTLFANEARFFRFRAFFGACSLQTKSVTPVFFFFAFLGKVDHYLSAWQVKKNLCLGTFGRELWRLQSLHITFHWQVIGRRHISYLMISFRGWGAVGGFTWCLWKPEVHKL